jgi:hypothetical protein
VEKEYIIEEIESAHMYPDDGRVPHVPFGFAHAKWIEFKRGIQPGDKIYDFASSPESWRNLAGRAGYVLVRDGKPVDTFVTLMN